jgi:cytidylate kinase
MIIAIDGPSGAGKSTLGKMLAKKLGLLYLDTGAMYRAVAFAVLEKGESCSDPVKASEIARDSQIELTGEPESLQIKLNGVDISTEIRSKEIAQAASVVSTNSDVRKILVKHQQELGKYGGGVLEGRDIGTVVFPDADVKFFLTARPEERAQRRYKEDLERGGTISYEQTLDEINQRDKRDVTREDSPLSIAEGAVVIDTSGMTLEEILELMLQKVEEKKRAPIQAAQS